MGSLGVVILVLTAVTTVSSVQARLYPTRDPCRNFQCRNGGTCTAPADRPFCLCPFGFTGNRCQIRQRISFDPCQNFRCRNGGRCTAPADAPYCLCPPGYSGDRCEIRTRDSPEHPGTCPVIGSDSVGVCGGIFCINDAGCPSDQKCCRSPCGGFLCTNVAPAPPTDPCGGCPFGQICQDTGIRCITTPCPTYQCVPDDGCGGCPRGQTCKFIQPVCPPGMACIQALIPTCVPDDDSK